MISPAVKELTTKFVESWRAPVRRHPVLELDGSWPSVGVLDLLTFPLRGQVQPSQLDKRLVKVCAAYLATLTHECWSTFGVRVDVDEGEQGIVIRAINPGRPAATREFKVAIELELRKLLTDIPNPFPVLGDFSRTVGMEQNIISLFALGLATGLTAFGEGAWLQETPDTFREEVEKAVKLLARTSAESYARLFPDEQLGQVAELYLSGLVYPPMSMNERFPLANATKGLVEFFQQYQVPPATMRTVTRNLARLADDQIAQAGLVVYGALCEDVPPPEILAVAESRGRYMGVLRPAMIGVRELLGLRADWLVEGECSAEDLKRYEIEMALGTLSWVKLSRDKIKEKKRNSKILPLLRALAGFEMAESIKLADAILADTPGDLEIRIQRLYLDLLNGDFERGSTECRKLLSEPGAELSAPFFNVWGLCELSLNNLLDAEKHFTAAERNAKGSDRLELYQSANNHAWALIRLEEYRRAIEHLDRAITDGLCPLTALLNKAYVLRTLGKKGEAIHVQEMLLKLQPLDRRVFGNLLAG